MDFQALGYYYMYVMYLQYVCFNSDIAMRSLLGWVGTTTEFCPK